MFTFTWNAQLGMSRSCPFDVDRLSDAEIIVLLRRCDGTGGHPTTLLLGFGTQRIEAEPA
jgi:hypothetical protein